MRQKGWNNNEQNRSGILEWYGQYGSYKLLAEGAKEKGAEVTVFTAAEFSAAQVPGFDAIAFGCPAMGAEVLEESEFQPMFDDVKPALSGKKLVLFGSYGWGTGEWMDYWKEDCVKAGAVLAADPLIINGAPDDAGLVNAKP